MTQDPIAPQDQADHDLGLELIRVLRLKRKRDNGRIETTHGDKTPCGLARTVRHLSASPLEKAAPELLEALQAAAELIQVARARFPKSIKHSDTFRLENTNAAINNAIRKATQA
jgi:hypothetical protein